MGKEELLEKLLRSYESSFDVFPSYQLGDAFFDAYAAFDMTGAKYVLSKKAELWRVQCYEHAFFRLRDVLTADDVAAFRQQIIDRIEPELVRRGQPLPPPDHMYSYVTGIFLCDRITPEAEKAARAFRYNKNYRLTFRGYTQARLLVFDFSTGRLFGNGAARKLKKGYRKIVPAFFAEEEGESVS